MQRIKPTRVTLSAGRAKHDGRPPIPRNFASELELPRMEKRLPTAAPTLTQVQVLLAVPNVADPLGVRDRAMLERYLQEVRPRLCLDTRTPALFLTGYGEAFNPDVLSRMVAGWMKRAVKTYVTGQPR